MGNARFPMPEMNMQLRLRVTQLAERQAMVGEQEPAARAWALAAQAPGGLAAVDWDQLAAAARTVVAQ